MEKTMDFSKPAVWEEIRKADCHDYYYGFQTYLKTGQTRFKYKDWPIVPTNNDAYIIVNDIIYQRRLRNHEGILKITLKSLRESNPFAAIVPFKKEKLFLLNGDDGVDVDDFIDEYDVKVATVSFTCISRFYGDFESVTQTECYKIWDHFMSRLVNGSIAVLDYTEDEVLELSAADRRKVDTGRRKALERPEAGFSLVGYRWHRAATVLFYDKENDKTFLIGQDEGTYFGCLLAGKPKTVQAAFTDLIPKSIRGIPGVKRHGEWFIVPCDESDVPAVTDCVAEGCVGLPRQHKDAAFHTIQNNARVAKDGVIYSFKSWIEHSNSDHEDVSWDGWVYFVKNTALESYSVEGVD